MSDELNEIVTAASRFLENKEYAQLDSLIDEGVLQRFQQAVLYYFKCIARHEMNSDGQDILRYVYQGLQINEKHKNLLEIHYIYAMRLELPEGALLSSSRLCESYPDNYNYQFWYAEALQKNGAQADAARAFSKAHCLISILHTQNGDLQKAIIEIDKSIQFDSNHHFAVFNKAKILYYQDEIESAIELLSSLQDCADIQVDVAELQCKIAEYYNDADAMLNFSYRILSIVPDHPYGLRVGIKAARLRRAIIPLFDSIDKVLSYHEDDIWSHLIRFSFAKHLADDDGFFLASHDSDVLYRSIDIFMQSGMYDAAVNRILAFPATDTRFVVLIEKAAWQLWRYNQFALMKDVMQYALQQTQPSAAFYGLLAESVSCTESMGKGLEIIQQGEQFDPYDTTLGYFKAVILSALWLNKESLPIPLEYTDTLRRVLMEYLGQHPHDSRALYAMAGICYSITDYSDAKRYIEQAMDDGISNVYVYYWSARILHKCGDLQGALEAFEQKFEMRSSMSQRKFKHYLTKAEILADLGDTELLQRTIDFIKQQWPAQLDVDYRQQLENWRHLLQPESN